MSLTATTVKLIYNGDGSTVSFTVSFIFWSVDDLKVILTDATGTETVWTRGNQYNVTRDLPSGPTKGTVVVSIIPVDFTPQTGETLTIISNLPDTQPSSFPVGGPFPAGSVEQQFDQNVRLTQQRSEELGRAMKFPVSELAASQGDLPSLATRKSKFLSFDLGGIPIAAAGTSANLGPVSAYIDTLLDDADSDTAQATLEVDRYVVTVGGTADAITLTPSPAITAYKTGQSFWWIASGANTGAVTVNISGLGAKAITKFGTTALAANDILSGSLIGAKYDGTQFQLITVSNKNLTSPVINSATGIGQSIIARKQADESVSSADTGTTLQDDDDLLFAIAASEEWVASIEVPVGNALLTTGIKVAVTVPSGATLRVTADIIGDADESVMRTTTISGGEMLFSAAIYTTSGAGILRVSIWVLNSTTPGNITLQWAQHTSSATILTLFKGGFLNAIRIA